MKHMGMNGSNDDTRHSATGKRSSFPSAEPVNAAAGPAATLREQRRKQLSEAFGRYIWEGDLASMREGSPRDWI